MLRAKLLIIEILVGTWISITALGHAGTISAVNCTQLNVQSAVDLASSGDTVLIPSGSCVWSSSLNIPTAKKINLKGAGRENTIITMSGTAIYMNESGSRVTGIGFILPGGDTTIDVKGTGWRIDHCSFSNTTGDSKISIEANGRNVTTNPAGLIDNCSFFNGRVLVNGLFTFDKMCGIWDDPLNLGTDEAVYIEDCTFTRNDGDGVNRNAIDANRGGRYVFRFNTTNETYLEAHSLQGSAERATRKWEIYKNTVSTTPARWGPMFIRGGTGVIWGNTTSGAWTYKGPLFDNYRSFTDIGGDAGQCDGGSAWDGNEDFTGWPCRDQIGRSTDTFLWNGGIPSQELTPAYLWLNRYGEDIVSATIVNNCFDWIKSNRDYYEEGVSFDGTSSVGVGTLSSRPATCTTGVAYWATDQGEWNSEHAGADGQLYKCTSTNTWKLYYMPYTYPHPMRDPRSPQNFRFNN